jgi:hypothetical protein
MTNASHSQQIGEALSRSAPTWLRPSSYWQPAHILTSAWLGHAPFAFWLVDVLRPRTIVELGTHYGFSCFAFAEAARRLGLDATVNALDSWVGDDQAGFYGDEVYDSVRTIAECDYPNEVRLMRGWFSESRSAFTSDSVDLLHIDGRHGYEDVRDDFMQWRETVRDGGVVLFHDISERSQGFGVWRLWGELSSSEPSFAFTHSHGLGVLGIGTVPDGPLADLFAVDEAEAEHIRREYQRLGERIQRQAWLEAMPAEVSSLHDVVERLQTNIAELDAAIAERDRRIEEIHASTSWRVTRPLRALGSTLVSRHRG